MLGLLQAVLERGDVTDLPSLLEAIRLLRRSDSFAGREQALERALRDAMATSPDDWLWVRDVFENDVVYSHNGTLFQVPYTMAGDEKTAPTFTFGTAEEVEVAYAGKRKPKKATEAGEIVLDEFAPLVERAVNDRGELKVKIIDAGWGSSGYYPKEVLKRDGPKVFTKGTHMYWNHPSASEAMDRPERDLNDLAGTLTSTAKWDDKGPAGPGLYATAEVRSAYREPVTELAPHIGVSIRAYGKSKMGEAEGKTGPIIEQIAHAESVDYVTVPGRGGEILDLFESARHRVAATNVAQQTEAHMDPKELTERLAQLEEANRKQAAQNAELANKLALREARDQALTALLADRTLHESMRSRLLERLVMAAPITDGKLDAEAYATTISEAIKAEKEYIASMLGEGRIVGMGSVEPFVTEATEVDEAAVDKQLESTLVGIFGESIGKQAAIGRVAAD